MNFARLNHILIPRTKAERDRYRRSRAGRTVYRLFSWLFLLSDEGRGAMLLWLLSGSISINIGTTQFYILWSALTGLLAASLLIAPRFVLHAVRLGVEAPRRTMVGEKVTFSIALDNPGATPHQAIRIRVPFLPWDGIWTDQPSPVPHLPAGERIRLTASARFSARGEHHLDVFLASALVPLGLANGPAVESRGTRFLVVPRIAPVAALDLRMTHRHQPGGVALASRTGESRELTGIRPYRSGDPIRDLHAMSWARTGVPHVREYRQEYFTRVGVVLDTDAAQAGEVPFEAALSLTAGLLAHLSRGEALIDLLVLGDEVHPLTLGRNLGFLDQALDLLACVGPGAPHSSEALESRIDPYLKRLSAVVYVTVAWDRPRRQLAERLLANGVPCRVIGVTADRTAVWQEGPAGLSCVTVSQINGSEALWL